MALQLHSPHQLITQPTSWSHVASPTWSSTEQVARTATKRFHTYDWRLLETCCRPWTWWCNDATALACYANLMMIMNLFNVTSQLQYRGGPNLHAIENADHGNRCRFRLPRELDRPLEFIRLKLILLSFHFCSLLLKQFNELAEILGHYFRWDQSIKP